MTRQRREMADLKGEGLDAAVTAIEPQDEQVGTPLRHALLHLEYHNHVRNDPERPFDGVYADLNYVSWYAKWTFEQRLFYLDWIIPQRRAEVDAWRAARHDNFLSKFPGHRILTDCRAWRRTTAPR